MGKKNKTSQIRETKLIYGTENFVDYPVIFEKNKDGRWTVSCPILPGCISEGDTKEAATKNIRDAIMLYLRAIKKEMQMTRRQGVEISKIAVGV